MSPVKQFGQAAEGTIAKTAQAAHAVVMGKELGPEGVNHLAQMVGTAVQDGVARPVNALAANTIATPSGGLTPTGRENADYTYRGAEMFGLENPAAK